MKFTILKTTFRLFKFLKLIIFISILSSCSYSNLNNNKVSILPKLDNYVNAANNSSDYDVISFNSNIQSGQFQTSDNFLVNADLNLDNGDLSMIGIRNVDVSDNRGVIYIQVKE